MRLCCLCISVLIHRECTGSQQLYYELWVFFRLWAGEYSFELVEQKTDVLYLIFQMSIQERFHKDHLDAALLYYATWNLAFCLIMGNSCHKKMCIFPG